MCFPAGNDLSMCRVGKWILCDVLRHLRHVFLINDLRSKFDSVLHTNDVLYGLSVFLLQCYTELVARVYPVLRNFSI